MLVLPAKLLIHGLSAVGLNHLQAWQGGACQGVPTGLSAGTSSQHVRPCAYAMPTAGQLKLLWAIQQ